MRKFWQGMITGGLIGGALGTYLFMKADHQDQQMEETADQAMHKARVLGRSASKMGSRVVKAGQDTFSTLSGKIRS